MARKSKKAIEPAQLTPEELYKLRAFIAEADLAQTKMTITLAQKKDYLQKIDPENKSGMMDEQIRTFASEAANKRAIFNETLTKIGTRIGIDINKCTWDDETGMVTIVDEI